MSMAQRDGFIWLDNEMVPWREAKTHVLTHTLHYGMGVFEGVRAYETARGPAIFRLKEHTDRLFNSAHILNMKIPYTKEQIIEMEQSMLTQMDFNIDCVSVSACLERFVQIAKVDKVTADLAQYMIEIALLDYSSIHIKPSYLAMSSLYLD